MSDSTAEPDETDEAPGRPTEADAAGRPSEQAAQPLTRTGFEPQAGQGLGGRFAEPAGGPGFPAASGDSGRERDEQTADADGPAAAVSSSSATFPPAPGSAPETGEQPVVPMRVLDESVPQPQPKAKPRAATAKMTGWALAGAGILIILGASLPLIRQITDLPDGRAFIMEISAAGANISQGVTGPNGPVAVLYQGGGSLSNYPLIAAGAIALFVALLMTSRVARMRWARPVGGMAAGLVLGTGLMLAFEVQRSMFSLSGSSEFQVHTALEPGALVAIASMILAIVTVVLVVRLPGDPAPAAREMELDTPPMGLPVIVPGPDGQPEQ